MSRAPVRGLDARGLRTLVPWLAAVPALALVVFAWDIGVDAPLPDDVDAILDVANRSAVTQGVAAQLSLWLEPHVDHRILTTRSLAALQLAIAGGIDLRSLAWGGVAALLLSAWMLPRLRSEPPAPPEEAAFAGAATAWLLLQPQAFDALVSPTVGANLLVLPPAIATLLALRRGGVAGLALAAACAALAAFTQGNGILVLPAGWLALLLAGRRKDLAIWTLCAALLAGLWWLGRATSRAAPLVPDTGDPLGALLYGLAFLGSAAGFGHRDASVVLGGALLLGLAAACARGHPRRSPWLWGGLAFALLSVAANTAARSALGADYAVAQPRYRIYAALVLALATLLALERLPARRAARYAPLALGVCIVFGALSYAHALGPGRDLAEAAARRLATWSVSGRWPARVPPADAGRVLARSRELGTFRADPAGLARHLDRVERREVPEPSAGRVQEVRLAADAHFRLLTGRLGPSSLGGFALERLRIDWVLDGDRVLTSRPVRGDGGSLRFSSVVPRAALPELPARLGLLLDDGARRVHIVDVRGGSSGP